MDIYPIRDISAIRKSNLKDSVLLNADRGTQSDLGKSPLKLPGTRLTPMRVVKTLFRWGRALGSLVLDYGYDLLRYMRHSATVGPDLSRARLERRLIINYHRLEKALTLRNPRQGFGQKVATTLLRDVLQYIARFGCDHTVQVSFDVLNSYVLFHRSRGTELPELAAAVEELRSRFPSKTQQGGIVELSSSDLRLAARGTFADLVRARHSIRQFSSRSVDLSTIREAVELALRTPSVCNRQMWRVRAYAGDWKDKLLALQNGNRGFGHEVPLLLVISGDLRYFAGSAERNQVYIDGGMFSMTLIYALHYLGLGTCALNLSIGRKTDRALRSLANIPAYEAFIMMIAVGHMEDSVPVTCSARRAVDDVFHIAGTE